MAWGLERFISSLTDNNVPPVNLVFSGFCPCICVITTIKLTPTAKCRRDTFYLYPMCSIFFNISFPAARAGRTGDIVSKRGKFHAPVLDT